MAIRPLHGSYAVPSWTRAIRESITSQQPNARHSAQMPSGATQSRTKPILALYRRALSTVSSSQPVIGSRHSQRSRRPSLHQIESDEYLASSRGSSRPPSPSQRTSRNDSEKDPQGKRGARPGRIVQPDYDAWATRHSGSPEPLAESGSPPRDSGMADGRAAADEELEVKIIRKSEAIRRVSAHLGYDTTRMPDSILKEVLAEMQDESQANPDPPSPMEITGGTAPALLQSADRMVLGRGPQPSTGGTPVAAPQEPEAELAYPDSPGLEAPPNDDSATEPESEPEIIELRPEDSVSQRIPLAPQPIPAVPLPSLTVPTPLLRSNLDTATIDESDDDATHNPKRRRLDAVTRSPPASASRTRTHTSASTPRVSSSVRHTLARTVAPGGHTTPIVPTPLSAVSSSLVNPPPTSNVDAVLVWATRLAAKAARPNTAANPRAGPSRQAGQTDQDNDQYGVLASVLEDLRSHLATSAPKSRANAERRLRRPRNTDFIEDDAELLEAEAALALGKRLRPRKKPCLADFPGFRRHIASSAIPDLVATLATQGMYEVYGTVSRWAEKSYNRTWEAELLDEPLQKAPAPLLAIMSHRGSCFRGETVERIRPEVPHLWPFIRTPHTSNDLQYNIRLARRLVPNQFHCRDPKTGTDPYEHPALQACIGTALFWGPESLGVIFQDRFRPLPLATVAFVLTMMQHCIQEWSTGHFVKTGLNVEEQRKVYESHLTGLLAYDRKAPTRLADFRECWFKDGLKRAGTPTELEAPYQPTTRVDQIRADSPDRVGHAAKGKGWAVY